MIQILRLPSLLCCVALFRVAMNAHGASLEVASKPYEAKAVSFGDSGDLSLSGDGKWAVFTSAGNGLATNDLNGTFLLDVFLRNLETGETTLLSRNSNGGSGNGNSYGATISGDGRFVVFETEADDLLADDDNEAGDVVIYDRQSGTLAAIKTSSGLPEGASGAAGITSNARWILFESEAAGFSPIDLNERVDLYLLERETGTIQLVSVNSNNTAAASSLFPPASFEGSVSGDGRFVTFVGTGTNLAPGLPANALSQIYLRDMVHGTNAWLSRTVSGAAATIVSSPTVSSNGAHVVFLSSNLDGTPTPTPNETILYIYDIAAGTRERVTSAAVDQFSVSENGQFIVYAATNQVMLYDISAKTHELVSINAAGEAGNSLSATPQISSDGGRIVFTSSATNLADGVAGEITQTYGFDRGTRTLTFLSRGTSGAGGGDSDTHFPVLSANGMMAGFMSYASNLATNDNPLANDVFAVPTSGGPVTLVSAAHATAVSGTGAGPSTLESQSLSADGGRLVFLSLAPDLVPNDSNGARDIFLRDLASGTNHLVTKDAAGASYNGHSTLIGSSLDGEVVAFLLIQTVDGTNNRSIQVYNASAGSNTVASISPTGVSPTVGDAVLSPNGRWLAFRESTTTTAPLFIRDLRTGETVQRAVVGGTQPLAFSPNGRYLAIRNTTSSVGIYDLQEDGILTNTLGASSWISGAFSADESKLLAQVRYLGGPGFFLTLYSLENMTNFTVIATNAGFPAMSADGSTVVYQLQPDLATNITHLYFYDTETGMASPLHIGGTNINVRLRGTPSLSANGRFVAFPSTKSFSAGGAVNEYTDIFVYDRVLKSVRLVSQNLAGRDGDLASSSPTISADGRVLAFDSSATDLVENDRNQASDVVIARLETVDADTDGLEDGWETIYLGGLGGNPTADDDSDGISNRDELLAGTNPKDAKSKFVVVSDVNGAGDTITLNSAATAGKVYQLQHRASLSDGAWQNVGSPKVAYSNSITFAVPLVLQGHGFFRIRAL